MPEHTTSEPCCDRCGRILPCTGVCAHCDTPAPAAAHTAWIDGKPAPDDIQAVHDAIMSRLSWASMHWGTERVHPDAWPHVAKAALEAAAPIIRRQTAEEQAVIGAAVRLIEAREASLRDSKLTRAQSTRRWADAHDALVAAVKRLQAVRE